MDHGLEQAKRRAQLFEHPSHRHHYQRQLHRYRELTVRFVTPDSLPSGRVGLIDDDLAALGVDADIDSDQLVQPLADLVAFFGIDHQSRETAAASCNQNCLETVDRGISLILTGSPMYRFTW
jgi:hypothetical protein